MTAQKITLRLATQEDLGFIFSGWLKSYIGNTYWTKAMLAEVFFRNHRIVVNELVEKYPVMMACNPDDSSHLMGFICGGPVGPNLVVHYCYVKESFRGHGIGSVLLASLGAQNDNPIVATHFTHDLTTVAKHVNFVYNPYLLPLKPPETKPHVEAQPNPRPEA